MSVQKFQDFVEEGVALILMVLTNVNVLLVMNFPLTRIPAKILMNVHVRVEFVPMAFVKIWWERTNAFAMKAMSKLDWSRTVKVF